MQDAGSIPGLGRSPGEGNGNSPVFLPGKSHGQSSLVDYSPRDHKRVRHNWATKQQLLSLIRQLYVTKHGIDDYNLDSLFLKIFNIFQFYINVKILIVDKRMIVICYIIARLPEGNNLEE